MYIYHLPYDERKQLCYILDQNNKWEELGGSHMQYDLITIDSLRKEIYRGNSPTSELLKIWGHQNHTVLELFVLLYRMKHYQAMSAIKRFIDEKYHYLIKDGEENLHSLMRNLVVDRKECNNRDPRVNPDNINQNTEKLLNVPKVVIQPVAVSDENNESLVQRIPQPRSPLPLARLGTSKMFTASDISCVAESAGAIPHITYEELQKSTDNWDTKSILGKGGFGTVYKGTWKCTQVAIKRLEQRENRPENHSEQIKQSITELHCLNAYRHDNVLPLYGYSIGGPHPCLIYQYMAGGSLDHRLRVRDPAKALKWPTRLNIAIGAARGLQFLHTSMRNGKPLVHGDIKSANILLDPNDQPRIGDFGLAREGPQSQYNYIKLSRIHGTKVYLPDEFLRANKFSTKVDTYSFGIVLFEIATSLSAYSEKREKEVRLLRNHVIKYEGDVLDLKDKRVEGYDECFRELIDIGKLCVDFNAKLRPEMVAVLILLEAVSCK